MTAFRNEFPSHVIPTIEIPSNHIFKTNFEAEKWVSGTIVAQNLEEELMTPI